MRFLLPSVLMAAIATLLAVGGQTAGQSKTVSNSGNSPLSEMQQNPELAFDQLAKGDDVILIFLSGMLRPHLEQFAEANNINSGSITRGEFYVAALELCGGVAKGDMLVVKNFVEADKDHNGYLHEAEMSANLKKVWKNYDKNRDGLIGLEEYRAFYRDHVQVAAAAPRAPQPEPGPDLRKALADPKPQIRLRAALTLIERDDVQAVAVLIELLGELPAAERREAEAALQQLAGEWSPNPQLAGDDELSRRIRREIWAAWWNAIDGGTLLAAFERRTLNKQDLAKVQALIEQLGDKNFAKRERAVLDLTAAGYKVVGLLREAAKSSDLEQAARAEACWKRIVQNQEKEKLPVAAPRLLAMRKPPGAAETLLAYLPFTDDYAMKDEIGKALKTLAANGGKADPAVVKALGDALPVRRAAAGEALAAVAGEKTRTAVRKLLSDADPQVRLRVAIALIMAEDKEAVPVLIDLVGQLPRAQAWEADHLLYKLAGAKAPPAPAGDDAAGCRKQLADGWRGWWKTNAATVDLSELAKTGRSLGWTVVAEISTKNANRPMRGKAGPDRIVALDRTGQPRWQIDNLNYPIDVQMLPGERVLIAEYEGNRVTERDLKGNVIWEVDLPAYPGNIQRLANGNTFIALCGTFAVRNNGHPLLEVDRTGKVVAQWHVRGGGLAGPKPLANGTSSDWVHAAHKMPDGKMVCLMMDNTCVWLDATGKELKRFVIPHTQNGLTFGNIDVTPRGHVLVITANNTLAEYDPDGKMVREIKVNGQRATLLANGNNLVSSLSGGIVEVSGTGQSVWQYQPPAGYQAVRARR